MTLKILQKSRIWGPSWPKLRQVGAMLPHLGAMLGHLGAMLDHFGAMLGHLVAMLEPCWANLAKVSKIEQNFRLLELPHRPKMKPSRRALRWQRLIKLKINHCNFNQLDAAFRHPPKTVPRGVQIPSQLALYFRCLFYRSWEPLGWIFGGFWVPSWWPTWLKNRSYGLLLASWLK